MRVLEAAAAAVFIASLAAAARAEDTDPAVELLLARAAGPDAASMRYIVADDGRAGGPEVERPVDPAALRAAYESQRGALDALAREATRPGPDGAPPAGALVAERLTGELAERLVRAAAAALGPGGADAPRMLKRLAKDAVVSKEHLALLWAARDVLVRRAVVRAEADLRARHPGLTIRLTIIDSGTSGTAASDVDKTLHVTVTDAQGRTVEPFGPGGVLGDATEYVRRFVDTLDAVGREVGVEGAGAVFDTEFFAPDTLPARFGLERVVSEGVSLLRAACDRMQARFQALQRNPGPSYQFDESVTLQVVGRIVESAAALAQRRARLAERRQAGGASLLDLLDEGTAHMHSPALELARGEDGRVRPVEVDVTTFLAAAGLELRYDRRQAAGVALGNFEKLVAKKHHIVDEDGVFHDALYDKYVDDVAKYGSRGLLDLATAFFDDRDRPAELGEFNRRFGHGPGQREYTRAVHDALLEQALLLRHKTDRAAARRELDLLWAVHRTNELVLRRKSGEAVGDPLGPLLEHLGAADPRAWRLLDEAQRRAAARRAHLAGCERGVMVAASSKLRDALDAWLVKSQERQARDRLRAQLEARAERLERELAASPDEVRRRAVDNTRRELDRVVNHWPEVKAELEASAINTLRRLYTLLHAEQPETFREALSQLPQRFRQDVEVLVGVFEAQGTERARVQEDLARRLGLTPAELPLVLGEPMRRRLGHALLDDLGVDAEAYFAGGAPGQNAPHLVLGRFVKSNWLSAGGVSSTLNVARVMQQNRHLPHDERLAALGVAIAEETAGGLPLLGPVLATYQGLAAGDAQAAGIGAVQLSAEVARRWLTAAGANLGGGRAFDLLAQSGVYTTLAFQIMKTSVELVGHEAFAPVRDDLASLVLTGVRARQEAGLIRAGTREVDARLPVDPIVLSGEPPAFLRLDAAQAARVYEWLEDELGEPDLSAHLQGQAAADGQVLVDLATDCALLARQGRERPGGAAVAAACVFLERHARVQQALRRLLDEERRAHLAGQRTTTNLWIQALRQGLGLHLEAQFVREERLLRERLLERSTGLTAARDAHAQDVEEAWRRWSAASPGASAAARKAFDEVMSPLARWDARLAALRAELGAMAETPPSTREFLRRRWHRFRGAASDVEARRAAAEQRLAAMPAYTDNRFGDETLPERWSLAAALAWYDAELEQARRDDPTGERAERARAERGLLEAAFAEADAAVAPKLAQLRLLDWMDGKPPFSEAQAALRFLWHDLATQAKVRDALAADLVSGRRLVPLYRQAARALEGLVDAAIRQDERQREAVVHAALLERQARAAQAVEGLLLDEDEAALPADDGPAPRGALRLRPRLELVRGGGGESAVSLVVESELTRTPGGAAVVVSSRVVSKEGDDSARIAAAAQAAGVALEQVRLVLRVDGRAGDVVAEPAFVLLLGEAGQAPPASSARGRVQAHPLARGAASAARGALPAFDPAEQRLYAGEPVVLLLDPARPADASFDWEVTSGGAPVAEGWHAPGRQLEHGLVPAPAGAALPFARPLAPLPAGTYTVRTQLHTVGGRAGEERAWRDEGTFEVLPVPLDLLGVVAETASVGLPGFAGRLDVVTEGSGPEVVLRAEATVRAAARADQPARGHLRRAELALSLPERLALSARGSEVAVRWAPGAAAPGGASFGAEVLPVRLAATTAPTPDLLRERGRGSARLAVRALADAARLGVEPVEGRVLLQVAADEAERAALGWLLREGAAVWYLPVTLTWGACKVHAFAAYGAAGTRVAGPAPVPPAPALTLETRGGGRMARGDRVELRATARGGTTPVGVRWRVGGRDVPGAIERLVLRAARHGAVDVELLAVDAVGRETTAVVPVDAGTSGPDSPTFDLVLDGPDRVEVGRPARFSVTVRGGRGPFDVRWTALGERADGPAVEVGFAVVGRHRVVVEVTDAFGGRLTAAKDVVVEDSDPLRAQATWRDVLVGQDAVLTCAAAGGQPPYRFRWQVGGQALEGQSVTAPLLAVASYPWSVVVEDSGTPPQQVLVRGAVTAHPRPVQAPPPPPPPAQGGPAFDPAALLEGLTQGLQGPPSVTIDGFPPASWSGSSAVIGQPYQVRANVQGGAPPHRVTWWDGHVGEARVLAPGAGANHYSVEVVDARGQRGSASLTVNGVRAPPTGLPGATPPPQPPPPPPSPPSQPQPASPSGPGLVHGEFEVRVGGRYVASVHSIGGQGGDLGQANEVSHRDARRWTYETDGAGLTRAFSFRVTCQAGDGRYYTGDYSEPGRPAQPCEVVLVKEGRW